jgi:signal transduction histidine kinase
MSIYNILPLISGILVLLCGFFVLAKNKKLKVNQIFFFFTIAVAIWSLASFMMLLSKTKGQAIFWDRIVYIGVIFIPITFYHFVLVFIRIKNQKRLLYLGYFLSLVFLILSRTDYFIEDLYKYHWGVHTQARFFHHIFLAFFASYICLSFSNIYRYYHQTKGIKRMQAAYIFLVLFIITLNSLAFLPAYNISISPLFSYLLPVIAVLILCFAIIKYHLFEIRVILTEILVGIMGVILVILPFLMPSSNLKILTIGIFLLFLIFSYYLIKATHQEAKRREEAEKIAIQERALRKKAEKLAKETERLTQAKEQFILSTQHYFRTPLTNILGFLELILEGSYGPLPEEIKEKIAFTLDSAKELKKRIEEGLDIGAFQTGKAILNLKEVQLENLVKEVIKEIKPQIEKKGLFFKENFPQIPLPKIKLDKERIREVFTNLIDNAKKHTLEGGIEIGLKEKEDSLLFWVKDTGIGIPKEELSFIGTQLYERGREAKKLSPLGKGIGLYLSKLIVNAHHGKLWAESEGIGKGSTFFVELPSHHPTETTNLFSKKVTRG